MVTVIGPTQNSFIKVQNDSDGKYSKQTLQHQSRNCTQYKQFERLQLGEAMS